MNEKAESTWVPLFISLHLLNKFKVRAIMKK